MLKSMISISAILAFSAAFTDVPADEAGQYSEYSATVLRIIDGDTLEVAVDLWPGLTGNYSVRVRGIDAPEIRRGSCPEKEDEMLDWGEEAKAQVEKLYPVESRIRLEKVELGDFAGRVIADVRRWRSDRWLFLKDDLLDRGLAVEWTPEMDKVPWCLLLETRQ